MTPERRTAILFWCQVSLFIAGAIYILALMALMWFLVISTMRTMEENRIRDKAMLQQHYEAMADHARGREEHARAFDAMLQRHRTSPSE